LEKTETLLERSKSAEIAHLGKSADDIFPAQEVGRDNENHLYYVRLVNPVTHEVYSRT